MKYLLILSIVAFCQSALSSSEEPYCNQVDRLAALTGGYSVDIIAPAVEEYALGFSNRIATMRPEMPERGRQIVEDEVRRYIYEQFSINKDLRSSMCDTYKEYFTSSDIKQMIEFYETDLGKKILDVLPELSKASAENSVGVFDSIKVELVKNIGARINKRFDEEAI